MSDFQKSITFTIMSAEVESLRSAIRAIWEASQDQSQTELQRGANVDQLIYEAHLLLPEVTKPDQREYRKEAFSDVLG